MEINGYELSRNFFDWSYENPELISPNHIALYFFIIEHCNRMGWKDKFGLPTTMAKEAIGIKNYKTYINTLNDLIDWGFIKMVQKSTNQYSANIVGLVKNTKANTKALSKATSKHSLKQVQSIDSIDKPKNLENNNHKLDNKDVAKTPPPEFTPCLDFWLKEFHLGWTFGGSQGKALKSIITKLKKILKDKDGEPPAPEKVIALFKNMCIKLPDWFKDKDLNILDSKFNEIISEIQNGQNANNGKIGKSNKSDIAKVFEHLKHGPTAEEIRNRGFGN